MNEYLQSIIDRDPAAKSKLSLVLTYPGVKAIFFHKIANFFAVSKSPQGIAKWKQLVFLYILSPLKSQYNNYITYRNF